MFILSLEGLSMTIFIMIQDNKRPLEHIKGVFFVTKTGIVTKLPVMQDFNSTIIQIVASLTWYQPQTMIGKKFSSLQNFFLICSIPFDKSFTTVFKTKFIQAIIKFLRKYFLLTEKKHLDLYLLKGEWKSLDKDWEKKWRGRSEKYHKWGNLSSYVLYPSDVEIERAYKKPPPK